MVFDFALVLGLCFIGVIWILLPTDDDNDFDDGAAA